MRLTHITTRAGDDGHTGLADGSRRPKTDRRIEAIGEVDELNSLIGLVATLDADGPLALVLLRVQHRLFDLGGELALPGTAVLNATAVDDLEQETRRLNKDLPPLEEFVLPGGTLAAAHCHQARAVCRRVERTLLRLAEHEAVNSYSLVYLNRLSDVLFVMARALARRGGGREIVWHREA
ncbi:MAG: cob(I)yrinic acid a,c-diamide adenosyltransferase [Gammaproteobacteria bacterium]|jgi:cob(I)alamin adenosyltransferase